MLALFFLGAAFGISAMSLIETVTVLKSERVTFQAASEMLFDIVVILLILHLTQFFII